jgi:phosphoribosylamine--glycine ligase
VKVLIVGGGGREHSLAWKIGTSPEVTEVICAPGNGGIAAHARCVPIAAEDVDAQVALAERERPDLVVVGPEAPLVAGIVDRLEARGIPAFGPRAAAARLEGSKGFAKEFMHRHGVPTARFAVHTALATALADIDKRGGPCVIKADGLAGGKGVVVCRSPFEARQAVREIVDERVFGEAGARVIVEDCLEGEEASVLAICDGRRFAMLIPAQDHKAAFEGDTGPNTGGMGAYAPTPVVTPELLREIEEQVIRRTVDGMAAEGAPFKGVLYAGLMIGKNGLNVLEYNVRFGDPECQPLVLMMKSDLALLLRDAAAGALPAAPLSWHDGAALCVVLAAGGYPGPYGKGEPIAGLDAVVESDTLRVFHAGTRALPTGGLVTAGGRVLGVTARGTDVRDAARAAYQATGSISWPGMRMRRDIGHRALQLGAFSAGRTK